MSTSILSRIVRRTTHAQPDRGRAPGRARWKLAAATLGVALAATSAGATIFGTTPAFVQILPAPASVAADGIESDLNLFAFNERQCFQAPAGGIQTDGGLIAAGTWVSCHFLHGDPVTTLLLSGQVLFSGPVLGVISSRAGLDATDPVGMCGVAGTTYPTGLGLRGLEAGDAYTVVAGGFGINATMQVPATGAVDQLRVITRCCINNPGGVCAGAPPGPCDQH